MNSSMVGVPRRSCIAASVVLLAAGGLLTSAAAAPSAARNAPKCPSTAIPIPAGSRIQPIVEGASAGASFCLKAGIHRLQTITPKNGQRFFGEEGSVLSGARVIGKFEREGEYWVATGQGQHRVAHGECAKGHSTCTQPAGFFIDGAPLEPVARKSELAKNRFFFDHARARIYFVDDPQGRLVEASVSQFAFVGAAENVYIGGLTIEKYYNPAQKSVFEYDPVGWIVEGNEFRYNGGVGASVGSNGKILNCNIHDNGQLGVTAGGSNILVEGNEIWGNNIYGFDPSWEAGGLKVTESENVVFRANHVHHNKGSGLWCDEKCRDVVFENNIVEYNEGAGIFHEISFAAVIRNNTLRENGLSRLPWLWGADIQIAASENVEVTGNRLTVRKGGRAIMLIDQNRDNTKGGLYKTRSNRVHHNEITFLGDGVTGGVSDAGPGDENFSIIETGGNQFDHNTYYFHGDVKPTFIWGHVGLDFDSFRKRGQEASGALLAFSEKGK